MRLYEAEVYFDHFVTQSENKIYFLRVLSFEIVFYKECFVHIPCLFYMSL